MQHSLPRQPQTYSLPLIKQVKDELDKMEQQNPISRVEGPINWCAGIVMIPDPSKKVHICADLTQLNKI